MLCRAARLAVSSIAIAAAAAVSLACAHPDTVVHVSAASDADARWQVRDADGTPICWLPCKLELDDDESVSVVRSDGRTRFVMHQQDLGPGEFSASVRVHRKHTNGALAGRVFAAALSGAGAVLVQSEDDDHVAAGVLLSGMGAAARIASDAARREREELWVQRTSTR